MIKLYADEDYEAFFFEDSDTGVGLTPDKCIIYANGEQIECQQASVISSSSFKGGVVQSLAFIDGQGRLHHGVIEPNHLTRQALAALDFRITKSSLIAPTLPGRAFT